MEMSFINSRAFKHVHFRAGLVIVAMFLSDIGVAQIVGSVRGVVTDKTGKPVSAAQVVIHAHPAPNVTGSSRVAFDSTAITGPDGSYTFPNVPAGPYRICARAANGSLVDSCAWNPSDSTLQVSTGAAAAAPPLVLTAGVPLRIHLDDPGTLLDPNLGKGGYLQIGVFTQTGLFIPAILSAKTAVGRDYTVLAPTGTPMSPSILSAGFQLTGAGVASANTKTGTSPTLTIGAGETEHVISVVVTGFAVAN